MALSSSSSDFREDELLNAIRAGHSEPDRPVVRFGLYLKIEERAASALEGNPLRDFNQRDLFRVQPKRVSVVELAAFLAGAHQLAREREVMRARLLVHHSEIAHKSGSIRFGCDGCQFGSPCSAASSDFDQHRNLSLASAAQILPWRVRRHIVWCAWVLMSISQFDSHPMRPRIFAMLLLLLSG